MGVEKLTKKQQKAIISIAEWFIDKCWKKATPGQKLDFLLMFIKPKEMRKKDELEVYNKRGT